MGLVICMLFGATFGLLAGLPVFQRWGREFNAALEREALKGGRK